jgi:hypothetical protein
MHQKAVELPIVAVAAARLRPALKRNARARLHHLNWPLNTFLCLAEQKDRQELRRHSTGKLKNNDGYKLDMKLFQMAIGSKQ